jgi:DNA polymerase V
MSSVGTIHPFSKQTKLELPLYQSLVQAGFPSPADDYLDTKLDLNKHLIEHPNSTFFVRVTGDSMIGVGIFAGDIVIVDRSPEPKHLQIVLAVVDGEFTLKTLVKKGKNIYLRPENEAYETIRITEDTDFQIWGVVTYTIHKPKP